MRVNVFPNYILLFKPLLTHFSSVVVALTLHPSPSRVHLMLSVVAIKVAATRGSIAKIYITLLYQKKFLQSSYHILKIILSCKRMRRKNGLVAGETASITVIGISAATSS